MATSSAACRPTMELSGITPVAGPDKILMKPCRSSLMTAMDGMQSHRWAAPPATAFSMIVASAP